MTQATAQQQRQPEEGIEPDDLDATTIVAVGLISTVLLVACVLGVTALFDGFQRSQVNAKLYSIEKNSITYGNGEAVMDAQRNDLNGYGQLAGQEGVYRIPIDRAKQLVLQELQAPLPTNSSAE